MTATGADAKMLPTMSSPAQSLLRRHWQAFWYVATIVLPTLLRTGHRLLIFDKYSGIGDILCTFPAVHEISKRHPACEVIYNCYADYACLPQMAGVAQRVTSLRAIGLVGYWYRFLLAGYYPMTSDDDRPDVEPRDLYIQSFGRHHRVEVGDQHPVLRIAPQALAQAQARLQQWGVERDKFIVLHCGPTWPVKQWPEAHWKTLVQELRAGGFESILQLGVANPLTRGAGEASAIIAGALSLEEPLALEESIALISQARLFIGIDSGLLHLAAALRIPSVSLWGPTSPQFLFAREQRRWFVTSPVACQGCHHRVPRLHWVTDCPYHIVCMQAIEPKAVLDAALAALSMKIP